MNDLCPYLSPLKAPMEISLLVWQQDAGMHSSYNFKLNRLADTICRNLQQPILSG